MKKFLFGAVLGSFVAAAAAYALRVAEKKKCQAVKDDEPEYVGNEVSRFSDAELAAERCDGEALPPVQKPELLENLTITMDDMTICLSAAFGQRSTFAGDKQTGANMSAWWPKDGKYSIAVIRGDKDEYQNGIYYWLLFIEDDHLSESKFYWATLPKNKSEHVYPKYVVALDDGLNVTEIKAMDVYSSKEKLQLGLYGISPIVQLSHFDNETEVTLCRMAFYCGSSGKPTGIVSYDGMNGKAKVLDKYVHDDLIGCTHCGSKPRREELVAIYKTDKNCYVYQILGDPGSGFRPKYCKDLVSSNYDPQRFFNACCENGGNIPEEYYEIMPYGWSPDEDDSSNK